MNLRSFFGIMGEQEITVYNTDCGTRTPYSGGTVFPTEIIVTLPSTTGTVGLNYDAYSIPDKFIVIYDGVEVINTGYRGDSSYQSDLDANLTSRGLPTETIAGSGANTTVEFTKSTSSTFAIVKVYGPLPGTEWGFTLSCPHA